MITGNPLIRDEYRPGVYHLLVPVVNMVARHLYDGFEITGLENIKNDCSNLYLMRHKSHFDYIFLNYILFINQKKIPFIAGRENIFKYLFFGGIFNHLGRTITIRKDVPLVGGQRREYRRQLVGAVDKVIKHNQDLAVFLEGGRNYKGGFGEPDSHIVKIVLEAGKDIHVVPVNFEYSYVIESEFFEKLEKAKKGSPEHILTDIWAFCKNSLDILLTGTKNGKIYLDFSKGFDLVEYQQKPYNAKGVCQRTWQELKELYVPPATALAAQQIEMAYQGRSKKTLEELIKRFKKPLEILRARRVISRQGNILNNYIWQHLLRNAAVKVR